jgi:hypothetical protein
VVLKIEHREDLNMVLKNQKVINREFKSEIN